MTICKMIPTGGWVGSLWIYFRSLQCSPSSALGSEEQNPTKHKKKKKSCKEKPSRYAGLLYERELLAIFSCKYCKHNVLPTCLCEDPLWYLSILLGYNLGEKKYKTTKTKLKQVKY